MKKLQGFPWHITYIENSEKGNDKRKKTNCEYYAGHNVCLHKRNTYCAGTRYCGLYKKTFNAKVNNARSNLLKKYGDYTKEGKGLSLGTRKF